MLKLNSQDSVTDHYEGNWIDGQKSGEGKEYYKVSISSMSSERSFSIRKLFDLLLITYIVQ